MEKKKLIINISLGVIASLVLGFIIFSIYDSKNFKLPEIKPDTSENTVPKPLKDYMDISSKAFSQDEELQDTPVTVKTSGDQPREEKNKPAPVVKRDYVSRWKLQATLIVPDNPGKNLAMIQNQVSKNNRIYRVADSLGAGTISEISRGCVVVKLDENLLNICEENQEVISTIEH